MMRQNSQQAKAGIFRALHERDETFVMPNAWNAGSACLLEDAGFSAIGTTSAGIAFCLGLPDYRGALGRDAAFEETKRIANAVSLPVSSDTENGYGHEPDEVAATITALGPTGVVGASIEDYGYGYESGDQYPLELSVERIKAARAAADALDFDLTLTARAECYLRRHPDPLKESIKRANAYREAGADCLYVPGVNDIATIKTLVDEIDGPINVVMGLAGKPLTVTQLEDAGVRRISIGGSLARTTFGTIRRVADEIRHEGTFTYAKDQIPDAELGRFFRERLERTDD